MSQSPLLKLRSYNAWRALKERCNNPKHQNFRYYGGAGISYDPSWDKYQNFLSDMGEPAPGMQIDRIDSKKNYCKENCRWVTPIQNSSNRGGWGKYKTKGVFQRPSGNWAASMRVDGKTIVIGTFQSQSEAAKAFDIAIKEWHGEYAVTNEMLGAV